MFARTVVGFALLFLTACKPSLPSIQEAESIAENTRYIPGGATTVFEKDKFIAWRDKNIDGIRTIYKKIQDLKSGKEVSGGCVGQDKLTCAAAIAFVVPIADDIRFGSLFPEPEVDVNGRDTNGTRVRLVAFDASGQSTKKLSFQLRLDRAGVISEVLVFLPEDPMFARTPQQYEETRLYEAVLSSTARTVCPAATPQSIWQWFENTVKPSAKFSPREFTSTLTSVSASQTRSAEAKWCGRSFRFNSTQGVDTDLVSVYANPSGTFAGMLIEVR